MMHVFMGLFAVGFKRPISSFLVTLIAGVAIGVFCPVPWIFGISIGIRGVTLLALVLFLGTMNDPRAGLGPMIFLGPIAFGFVSLLSIGGAYYLATGQTGIQEAFAWLRSLTN